MLVTQTMLITHTMLVTSMFAQANLNSGKMVLMDHGTLIMVNGSSVGMLAFSTLTLVMSLNSLVMFSHLSNYPLKSQVFTGGTCILATALKLLPDSTTSSFMMVTVILSVNSKSIKSMFASLALK